jgi:succinate dehydrogenase / fumarate reductase cytochrome b subunit
VNKKRPVNLDLWTIRFPIPALVSITHRVSGVVLLAGILILMYMLDASLASEESFLDLQALLAHPVAKLVRRGAVIGVVIAVIMILAAGWLVW